jgi:hypothetical protein
MGNYASGAPERPKLLDQVRSAIRVRHGKKGNRGTLQPAFSTCG